jgi:outer membrane protein
MSSIRWSAALAAVVGGILLAGSAAAQTKVGIISLQKALQDTAEIKQAQADLEAKFRPKTTELAMMEKDIAKMQADADANQGKFTELAMNELLTKLQRRQRDFQRLGQSVQEEVNRERQDILTKSGARMQEVIKKLSEEKGLDVVVDASTTLYFKPAHDLSAEATAAYDRAYPAKK